MTQPGMSSVSEFSRIFTKVCASHTLEVLDDRSTTFRSEHEFTIRAEISSRFFLRRFVWTGGEHDDEPLLHSKHDRWGHPIQKIHGPLIREGKWRLLMVDLGQTVERGETAALRFTHSLRDLNGSFQPFLGHAPDQGTEQIRLKVILPTPLSEFVYFDERVHESEQVLHSERIVGIPLDGNRSEFQKEISNLSTFNRGYRLRWAVSN